LASTEKKGNFDGLLQFDIEDKQKGQTDFDPIDIVYDTGHTTRFIASILSVLITTASVPLLIIMSAIVLSAMNFAVLYCTNQKFKEAVPYFAASFFSNPNAMVNDACQGDHSSSDILVEVVPVLKEGRSN
jgi:hypothetical protein